MKDLVSEELEHRLAEPVPWRSALLAALAIHAAVAMALLLAPGSRHRALTLPRVQVRIAPALPAPPGPAADADAAPPRSRPAPPPAAKPRPSAKTTKASPKPAAPKTAGPERPVSAPPAAPATSAAPPDRGSSRGDATRAAGAVGLGGGSGDRATDEAFPYAYYLNRVLGMIESNWFRPPAPAATRCRVLCRIDRTGRVADVGLEEASDSSAFDRAALRAVYASAPFPPLPQSYGGDSLTLHLEFGPQ